MLLLIARWWTRANAQPGVGGQEKGAEQPFSLLQKSNHMPAVTLQPRRQPAPTTLQPLLALASPFH